MFADRIFWKLRRPVISAVLYRSTRSILNATYGRASFKQKQWFHRWFALAFENRNPSKVTPGVWSVYLAGKKIKLPLSASTFWLDWAAALSIVGHDVEIKETYENLLLSKERPATFIDIGANYGTHSLLFLVHGIDVLTIEPNANCHPYFLECCRLNRVMPQLKGVAVGDARDQLRLSFPEDSTWLGSVDPVTSDELSLTHDLKSVIVDQIMIDDLLPSMGAGPILIKIDAEGFEFNVLRGAAETIKTRQPMVIFEAFETKKSELFEFFKSRGYQIATLPWEPSQPFLAIDLVSFLSTTETNFIARSSVRAKGIGVLASS